MFFKTLGLAQLFTSVHVMLYSVFVGIEFQDKNYDKLVFSAVLAVMHLLVLIHLLSIERYRQNMDTKDKL